MASAHFNTTDDTLVELTQLPPVKTTEKPIGQHPGLRFKHYAGSGAISFVWMYRNKQRKQRKMTLGKFSPDFGIKQAVTAMTRYKAQVEGGFDPQQPAEARIRTVGRSRACSS
jgi:hypothetical protein